MSKGNFVTKKKETNAKKYFQCEVCGHSYLDKETAIKCYLFCDKHQTCSAKITKKAVHFPSLPTHLSDKPKK